MPSLPQALEAGKQPPICSGSPLLSGFISAFHPSVPGSKPKLTIYAFYIYSLLYCICHCNGKRTKINKKRPALAHISKLLFFTNIRVFVHLFAKEWSVSISVTRLGYFWKIFATNLISKVTQIIDDNLANFKMSLFPLKLPFWEPFGKIGLLLF